MVTVLALALCCPIQRQGTEPAPRRDKEGLALTPNPGTLPPPPPLARVAQNEHIDRNTAVSSTCFSDHTYVHCRVGRHVLTWKNCSCFSSLQKKGCMRTMGAEGRCWGSGLIIAAISSRATSLSVGETTQQRNNPPKKDQELCPSAQGFPTGTCLGEGSHHELLPAGSSAGKSPIRCWPVAASCPQRGAALLTPRSRRCSRLRRCPQHTSAK